METHVLSWLSGNLESLPALHAGDETVTCVLDRRRRLAAGRVVVAAELPAAPVWRRVDPAMVRTRRGGFISGNAEQPADQPRFVVRVDLAVVIRVCGVHTGHRIIVDY